MNMSQKALPYAKLLMNIQFPDLEDCYSEGFNSQSKNLKESSNPYPENSLEYEQWQEGWWASFYNEEPIFEVIPEIKESFAKQDSPAKQSFFHRVQNWYQDINRRFDDVGQAIFKLSFALFIGMVCFEVVDMAI